MNERKEYISLARAFMVASAVTGFLAVASLTEASNFYFGLAGGILSISTAFCSGMALGRAWSIRPDNS